MRLDNPLVLASGVLGTTASTLAFVAAHGAGAVTTKSCSLEPRTGHPTPIVAPVVGGLLNAVGLSNPGARAMAGVIRAFRARSSTPVFASVFGRDPQEFAQVTAILAEAEPHLVELNVSCPNVASEYGTPFGADARATARVVEAVKARSGRIPVSVKLTIAAPSLREVARACREAGADAITAINTVGPGMAIEIRSRRPILSNREGGLSGPAILPLAVRAIWEVAEAVDLPIIGTGGVESAEDALQMILAGATAIGIGTAVWRRGIDVFGSVRDGLDRYLEERGGASLAALRGAAHG
ncbi:MAG: dihydroorotate dehydrogenase [Deltaproteobacteria bacterium]|nr:dihydroorotate dehydrogenase [Deltaproteobacteria bacterium]